MKNKFLLLVSLFGLLSTGCSNNQNTDAEPGKEDDKTDVEPGKDEQKEIEEDARYKTYYQLLVYSFADGNGDGIGDFKGIIDKLDYLVDLGVEGLWLSPILDCDSYHAYDVKNYEKINPKYEVTVSGKKYDYSILLEECHKRGISVLMDLVLNHTSTNHTWYKNHRDWYSGKNVFGDSMPDLDYSKQAVQDAVINVGKYWLERGFDGYRLDAAMRLYNKNWGTDASSVDHNKNYAYWTKWCDEMRKVKSDAYIVAEVLNSNHNLAFAYAKGGFDSTFNFNVRTQIEQLVKNKNYDYVNAYNTDLKKAKSINKDFILSRPLSNHDIGRFTCIHKGMNDEFAHYVTAEKDIRLANAINVLTPGNAFIYYGDELGLTGSCPEGYSDMNYRTPMPFKTETTDSIKYFEEFHGNGRTISKAISGKSAEEDAKSTTSLYGRLAKVIKLKKEHNAIKQGVMSTIEDLPANVNGYKLSDGKENIYVAYNVSGSDQTFTIDEKARVLLNCGYTRESGKFTDRGYIVYKI